MNVRIPRWVIAASLTLLGPVLARADEPAAADDGVPAVPATRDDLKRALEESKHNQPRLPLPSPTEADRARAASGDSWGIVNNGLMRRHYLPAGVTMGGFSREPDSRMTLGYPFQTRLFWIVSRANNCTYCMGHQETKLSAVGMIDDEIAALDGDWANFSPAEQTAFAFTRKLTFEPHDITDADLDALRAHYDDDQMLEIIAVVGNFNAMNRWTGALRIPQEDHREYLTPTSEPFRDLLSRIAPLPTGRTGSAPSYAAPSERPPLESRAEVEAALSSCRERSPRIPLASDSDASDPTPNWERLLLRFPVYGPARIAMHRASESEGELDPRFKAIIAYVAARYDRAWYALGHAERRLGSLGFSSDEIAVLDDLARPLAAQERSQLGSSPDVLDRLVASFTRKLTVDPALIGDSDIAVLRAHFNDKEVAEIVFQITEAAFFDRLTEAAGLPLEATVAGR